MNNYKKIIPYISKETAPQLLHPKFT